MDGAKVLPIVDMDRDDEDLDVEGLERGIGDDPCDPLERLR